VGRRARVFAIVGGKSGAGTGDVAPIGKVYRIDKGNATEYFGDDS